MSTQTVSSAPQPTIPAEVVNFAREQGVEQYLLPLIELARQVYPSADRLPENQLKFYLHFSAPMSQGDCYRHIKLLDARGKAVDLPFLELDQELWDPTGTRFTLFFDPWRIKRAISLLGL